MLSKEMVAFVFAIVMALAMTNTCIAQNSPDDYVDAHNKARSAVGVGNVTWDATVQAYAQNYANIRKADCKLAISNVTGPYGENLAVAKSTDASGIDVVNFWVSFKQYYSYANNSCASGEECGTYTQVVWRNTTKIGCARTVCDKNAGVFFICNYSPRGNIAGEKPY